jgi:pyridoxamine 5'-phosphate oxidase
MTTATDPLADPRHAEPLAIVSHWLAEATARRQQANPNSMVLATTSADGKPSARVVLCKGVAVQPGYVVFYTNYESRKGQDLAASARAAAVMHWDYLQRQVRITGPVERSPEAESDAYFASRPWPSRIAAWASAQSRPIGSRAELIAAVAAAAQRFGTPVPDAAAQSSGDYKIPRPPHWAEEVELWQEGKSRIHDRVSWSRALTPGKAGGFEPGPWSVTRLQP